MEDCSFKPLKGQSMNHYCVLKWTLFYVLVNLLYDMSSFHNSVNLQ